MLRHYSLITGKKQHLRKKWTDLWTAVTYICMEKATHRKLLIIEDDEDLSEVIRNHFRTLGYFVDVKSDALGALSRLRKAESEPWDLILTDLKMPGMDGVEFIHELKRISPNLPVILMTAHGGVEVAVNAVKAGAYDFVMKPLNFAELAVSIERAIAHSELKEENRILRDTIVETRGPSSLIAKSTGMKAIQELVARIAKSTATVLVTGESGTGKEVIARLIHQTSLRNEKPFVAINCAAIPETLLESELFGFAKGSFTGAIDKKVGLFEEAEGGTLFLDEIGDLSGPLQAKLLRVLQERKIKRIGENQPRDIDVRVIAATHKNLEQEVRDRRFREDLFFRLNVIPVRIPPLRERREDILPMAESFLKKFSLLNQKTIAGFTKDALALLTQAPWRGNVRELENVIERAVVLCQTDKVSQEDFLFFPSALTQAGEEEAPKMNLEPVSEVPQATVITSYSAESIHEMFKDVSEEKLPTLEEWELVYIDCVVKKVEGVRERARRILDIDRKTLYKKLDQYAGSSERASTNLSN